VKQKIAHGALIDTVTPAELGAALRGSQDRSEDYQRHRKKGIIQLDANGAGKDAIHVSRQYNWRMERVTIGGAGAVNALLVLFESDSTSDADMLEVIQVGTAGRYSDSFSNNIWVPAGNRLILQATGGVPSGQITFNFQVRLVPVPAST
jgi:hypothetical protein